MNPEGTAVAKQVFDKNHLLRRAGSGYFKFFWHRVIQSVSGSLKAPKNGRKVLKLVFKRIMIDINWKLHLYKYATKDKADANESVNALGERP